MKFTEILAPCGSEESVVAAVNCGCDAIYIGAKDFSARKGAQNFDEAELARTVSYCHARDVKVYQAVNTLVFDEEYDKLCDCIKSACDSGVDALIVQDFGVLEIVKKLAPDMPVHASTQMTVHSLEGAKFAQSLGIKRVVLAREMTLSEIENIAKNTDLELEVFVHGALCMCVSGQCYMSAMIGSRSGNRGLCAGTCRLPFTSTNKHKATNEYALSLKDLSCIEQIKMLADIGVQSFKIEGRLKRPEYVAASVTACRQALNGEKPDIESLQSIFSRSGFTNGYIGSHRDEKAVHTFDSKNMFGYRTKDDVVSMGAVLKPLANLYNKQLGRVALDFEFTAHQDQPIKLVATDGINRVEAMGEIPQLAINKPTDKEAAARNLAKIGGTYFFMRECKVQIGEGLMVPASAINAVRRQVCEQIEILRSKVLPKEFKEQKIPQIKIQKNTNNRKISKIFARFSTLDQASENTIKSLDFVILPLEIVENSVEKLKTFNFENCKIVIELPRVCFANEGNLAKKLGSLKSLGFDTVIARNLAHIKIANDLGIGYFADFTLNIANSYSVDFMQKHNALGVCTSIELTTSQIAKLGSKIPLGVLAYGKIPLMVTRNCPVKAEKGCKECHKNSHLTDRLGAKFPVICQNEYVEIFNCDTLYLADRLNEFCADYMVIYFTDESQDETEKVISEYVAKKGTKEKLTRGLYYRGVL
ncbi:MAG: U32 family peptidase [Oscillospiraceae bacterium]|nr:U32 family peptidase [Oscillospiraceae bacterium]